MVLVVPAHSLEYVSNYLQHPHFYTPNPPQLPGSQSGQVTLTVRI